MHPKNWIEIKPEGLYCIPGQFYIDPVYPVDKAIITHGHSDHARPGHNKVLASPATIGIMKIRYGEHSAGHFQSENYYSTVNDSGVQITLLPAGHVLGSAQVLLKYKNSSLIISGDYKRQLDATCQAFAVTPCDVFITEATFGLPIFHHPPIEDELNKLLQSVALHATHCHLVGTYALGKCQRIIRALRDLGFTDTIYLHGALLKLCQFYQSQGVELGVLALASELTAVTAHGKIILCPPSALRDRWSRRFGDVVICLASGWMQVRARVKQKGVDLPLLISDHADWPGLTTTIQEINPSEVWVTHGQEDALIYFATQMGYKASALSLLGYDEDED